MGYNMFATQNITNSVFKITLFNIINDNESPIYFLSQVRCVLSYL